MKNHCSRFRTAGDPDSDYTVFALHAALSAVVSNANMLPFVLLFSRFHFSVLTLHQTDAVNVNHLIFFSAIRSCCSTLHWTDVSRLPLLSSAAGVLQVFVPPR